jgi:ABC-2 type transport system permease protein
MHCSAQQDAPTRAPRAGVMQPFIQALPLTGLVEALRGVMLDGSTLAGIGSEVAVVAAWGLASLLIAIRIFRWQ